MSASTGSPAPRVGIVCTLLLPDLRSATSVLRSFTSWHLALGFDHLYLYFDSPDDPTLAWARSELDPRSTTVLVRGAALDADQRSSCPALQLELEGVLGTEVPARQRLNAAHALGLARERGLDWLLHIDVDELFYLHEGSVAAHFSMLQREGALQFTYANHEAVPERTEVGDYFREVTLFRRNHLTLGLEPRTAACQQFWSPRAFAGWAKATASPACTWSTSWPAPGMHTSGSPASATSLAAHGPVGQRRHRRRERGNGVSGEEA